MTTGGVRADTWRGGRLNCTRFLNEVIERGSTNDPALHGLVSLGIDFLTLDYLRNISLFPSSDTLS